MNDRQNRSRNVKGAKSIFILELGRFLGRIGKQQEASALIIESQALSSTPGL